MENTLQELITEYFTIVQQKAALKSGQMKKLIRGRKNQNRWKELSNGSGSRLDYLQTKADLNALRSAELNQESTLESTKIHWICDWIVYGIWCRYSIGWLLDPTRMT